MLFEIKNSILNGKINLPSSKSVASRFILSSIFSKDTNFISGYGYCEDISACYESLKILKPDSSLELFDNNRFLIKIDENLKLKENLSFNCFSSAFCFRALSIIVSSFEITSFISGSKQLFSRPQHIIQKTLKQGRAKLIKTKDGFFIKGKLNPGKFKLNTNISTQHISGLLMTLPFLNGDSVIEVKGNPDNPYIDLTLNILKSGGIEIIKERLKNNLARFYISANSVFDITDKNQPIVIEADWSCASFFIVAATLAGPIEFLNLNLNSKQADIKILEIIKLIGAKIKIIDEIQDKNQNKLKFQNQFTNEIQFDSRTKLLKENKTEIKNLNIIEIQRGDLKPFEYNIDNCPDLFPIISVLASFCDGKSKIYGIERLKYKESNRIKAIYQNFKKVGIEIKFEKNHISIKGNSNNIFNKIANSDRENIYQEKIILNSFNDHRIFMSLAILASFFKKKIIIEDNDSYKKSYYNFLDDFKSLGGKYQIISR